MPVDNEQTNIVVMICVNCIMHVCVFAGRAPFHQLTGAVTMMVVKLESLLDKLCNHELFMFV